jgi:hypothetical protein
MKHTECITFQDLRGGPARLQTHRGGEPESSLKFSSQNFPWYLRGSSDSFTFTEASTSHAERESSRTTRCNASEVR